MRKTLALIACAALTALGAATAVSAQDRYEYRDDRRWERRDDRRDDRWGGDRWGGGPDLVLFEHRDFGGEARPIRGDIPDLVRLGFNDRVSSFKIFRGEWEMCEHAYFQGRCWRYSYDMPVLPNKQNDRYSSVRRIR
ncbi:beta/gamma crystallin-related protein [Caulobacter sp. SSI4214]|uniref:beta/gamma crystallin-related protein n=1 Tax=Caulobacter sp. SSI4214 TaxID=2575739 RepID=UPI00143B67E7|nr:beta/gamma crystallin-related protein [Caulobacter sp. SSI4214]